MSIIDNFVDAFCKLVSSDKQIPQKPKIHWQAYYAVDSKDMTDPNLYVGKILNDSILKCEVVDVHKTNIHVKILEIHWDRMGTYLDVGNIYPVFKHSGWNEDNIQVWEISSKRMKRSSSQVILQWEKGSGWTWDLDS
jgi:hypothetical protein